MASIIFKNFIINRSKDEKYDQYWVNLDTEFKSQIKMAILATLASPKALVRGQIANVLASIASIEIPRKEWDDLVPNLCNNSTSEDINIKLASLTTLGYICEELHPDDLNNNTKNNIILALTNNINAQPPIEPTRLAIKALLFSIPYTRPNFEVQQERDFIMKKVFEACQSTDEEVQEFALHCLREICAQEYESVQFYFNEICMVTEALTRSESPKVGAQAFEVWTTLAEDETERRNKGNSKSYIESCKDKLLIMILQGLLMITFEEDEDDDEWGPALSAACCL